MDYLISEGYPSAAQKFAHEANVTPMLDVDSVEERVAIREALHKGNIQDGIEKINELDPQLLDRDESLHFALLRLQLIELIRPVLRLPEGDIMPAVRFAQEHLAPRAPTKPEFLEDLERTMALLIFDPDKLSPPLIALLQPELRQEVGQRVNRALLASRGERTKATLYDLVNLRAWANQKAKEAKKEHLPDQVELGFDTVQNGHDVSQNGSTHQSNGQRENTAARWENEE
ncbi:hypothetical protein ACLMJK_003367 [Lecanora helva]